MDNFLQALTGFIYSYDNVIIFVFAAINLLFFALDLFFRKSAEQVLYPSGNKRFGVNGDATISKEDAVALQQNRVKVVMFYSLYANFTAIFPLLGILGTVAGLVTVAGTVELMDNLMVALTTTLNGVFWAILFKATDTFLSGPMDAFLEDVDSVLRKAELIPDEAISTTDSEEKNEA